MYTQCPDCATVFRVTAEALRIAQGDVRCGVCSTSFNALENLSEQAFKAGLEAEAPVADDSMTVEELPGSENIELSAPVELAVVPEPEAAALTSSDPAPPAPEDEEQAMEFHGDAAELDRLFVVENPAIERFDPPEPAVPPKEPEPDIQLDNTDEHPIIVIEERDEPEGESIVLETVTPVPAPLPAAPMPAAARPSTPPPLPKAMATGHTAPRILIPDEMRKRLAEEAEARAAVAAVFEPDDAPGLLSQRWPWVTAVAALAVLLLVQIVHGQRDALVRGPIGPAVAGIYSLLGLSVLAPTDLTAYELRQWGAASDPNTADRLMLRASIVNRASYAQPFPLLRLTLQDRFGGTLGLRDIGPADYLPGAGGGGLLGPGERADALIRIVDPGTEAVGFELDVCLPAPGGVRCANQIKTARQ
ncbi:MAG TPA: DUF3426 domain-containing protein [Steroidobacteraceae bacterium]|nr:DUF3426 domain-containing protein [Steroidobacteraceae bacterium]